MNEHNEWEELIDRHLRDELSESEKERLAERLDSDPSARREFVEHARWDTRFAEVLRESRSSTLGPNADETAAALLTARDLAPRERRPSRAAGALLAIAAMIIVALSAGLYFARAGIERPIAKITGMSGSLQWTGDGGRVFYDLRVGAQLPGGTVEGMVPGSWFELQFADGSTVTISGISALTFSENGQKKLHLKEGNLSADVKPQPAGRPMLIYTRSAMLEVIGTRFEVESGLSATMLNVSKGTVRVKRLSDGTTVDVLAQHRVIAAADREMLPVLIPAAANRWRSQLQLGPGGALGNWSPKTGELDARLRTVPYTTPFGKTIYSIGFGVSCGDRPPITLQPGSRCRVRGRMASSHPVYFGVTVRRADGGFAGNFQTIRPAAEFPVGQNFEVVLDLQDFRLDPSPIQMKDKLSDSPFHLVLDSMWCHTLYQQAGLEIIEVELIPPVEEK